MTKLKSLDEAKKHLIEGKRKNTLEWLIVDYKASHEFKKLSEVTKRGYNTFLKKIEERYKNLPINALNSNRIRGQIIKWRDEMADNPRTADSTVRTFSTLVSWAYDRGMVEVNHLKSIKNIYKSNRADIIWMVGAMSCS